jgi:type III restriction enzyme
MAIDPNLQRFRNEDLVLQVSPAVNRARWDESRYDQFLDALCGEREYQKEAIRVTLRYLLGGEYSNLRELARRNFKQNPTLAARYGSWAHLERSLQLPDQLAATLDLATGAGKSYVLYGLAAILLAEDAVDRVLVLCPSTTIELGLTEKFRLLASDGDLRDLLPSNARVHTPRIIQANQTIIEGSICVENYHAILKHVGSSISDSLKGKGERTLVLNDETHHVVNESKTQVKRWKEFLQNPDFGFKTIIGVSGTCYVGDDYFNDVIFRYSLRTAMEEHFAKKVHYIAEMPKTDQREEKWQLIYNHHQDTKRKLRNRALLPLTIIVTQTIEGCKDVAEELKGFLIQHEGLHPDDVKEQVLVVYNNAPDVKRLPYVDNSTNRVEWIVSVSMLNEGWDVKRVFQIVPHEERAFNSKLLIAQVLGRGLRVPDGWKGNPPEVTVFNHDRWAPRIRHLINEVLEIERRISCRIIEDSPYHFELHNIDYEQEEQSVKKPMSGQYTFFAKGYIDLFSDSAAEDVAIEFEDASTGRASSWRTTIRRKTHSAREIAELMYDRLLQEDEDAQERGELDERGRYTDTWSVEQLEQVVRRSLENIKAQDATDSMKQKFLQSLGTLRRGESENMRYTLNPREYTIISTRSRQSDSVSAAELSLGSNKTLFFTDQTQDSLADDQIEFFEKATEEGSGYRVIRVHNHHDFKTALSAVIADSDNERGFIRDLLKPENLTRYDAWLKSTTTRFYEIDYSWKKRNTPKQGKFNPDFFIKIADLIQIVEIKGDEELGEPSEENIKKFKYAKEHFERLNQHLQQDGSPLHYGFTFLSPKSFGKFFQALRDGQIEGFTSELDLKLKQDEEGRVE